MQIDYLARHDHFLTESARRHFAEWSHSWPGDTVEARAKRLRLRCGNGGIPSVFVAFEGPALCGSAGLIQNYLPNRPNLEPCLAGVYVTPSMRRQGIGTALVSAVQNEARRRDITRLYRCSATAERYHACRGWVVLERLHRRGELQAVIILDLVLA